METSLLKRRDDILVAGIDGELVMLDLKRGQYFGIEGAGVRIWDLLAKPISATTIADIISREFDVTASHAYEDSVFFCSKLQEEGLVEICR